MSYVCVGYVVWKRAVCRVRACVMSCACVRYVACTRVLCLRVYMCGMSCVVLGCVVFILALISDLYSIVS